MSHAEIWDDTSLVDSWNEALAEYKHYHSLHARGERVEDILKLHDTSADFMNTTVTAKAVDESATNGAEGQVTEDNEEGELKESVLHPPASRAPQASHTKLSAGDHIPKQDKGGGPLQQGPPLPQHLVGSVHDESLKSLLMAWYYAGYYTGLHEGQHLAKKTTDGANDGSS